MSKATQALRTAQWKARKQPKNRYPKASKKGK